MRIKLLTSVLALGFVVSNSFAQQSQTNALQAMPFSGQINSQQQAPYFVYYIPTAPDMMGPGFYYTNCYGVTYGPNYCVTPPFAPCNGPLPAFCPIPGYGPGPGPGPGSGSGSGSGNQKAKTYPGMSFPTHPYVRSSRDYFMVD
jgi:hypothetical protein